MTIGLSIFLIAAGAILKYAITVSISGVKLDVVGTILMVAGILGLVISLILMALDDRRGRGAAAPYDAPTRRDRL